MRRQHEVLKSRRVPVCTWVQVVAHGSRRLEAELLSMYASSSLKQSLLNGCVNIRDMVVLQRLEHGLQRLKHGNLVFEVSATEADK